MEGLKGTDSTAGCYRTVRGSKRSWTLLDEGEVESSQVVIQDKKMRRDNGGSSDTIQVGVANLKWPKPHQ